MERCASEAGSSNVRGFPRRRQTGSTPAKHQAKAEPVRKDERE
jgi:hypothetical protein